MAQGIQPDIRERSYSFALHVVRFAGILPERQLSRIIMSQLMRSAASIGAYIVEAEIGIHDRDMVNYLNRALQSANESGYWLRQLRDAEMEHTDTINNLIEEAKQLADIIGDRLFMPREQ